MVERIFILKNKIKQTNKKLTLFRTLSPSLEILEKEHLPPYIKEQDPSAAQPCVGPELTLCRCQGSIGPTDSNLLSFLTVVSSG